MRVKHPELKFPANSTGDLILGRAGLVKPRRKKRRTPADGQPFSDCTAVNQCWSVDFKGDFAMGNKRRCYPLTVTDNYSRYILLCQGVSRPSRAAVFPHFERLFRELGLPWSIRSDNGSPFASRALGGLSALSKWWVDLGIRPERIEPGEPQQNGRHERMHRSLKDYLKRLDKIEANLEKQQQRFDEFRKEFNEFRSHESLGDEVPASFYQPSLRIYPTRIESYDYNEAASLRKVKRSGEIKWQGRRFYVSQVLAGEHIALIPYADGVWEMYYRFHLLGQMLDRERKIQPVTQWHKQQMCKPCARVKM
ncbi:MAG: integrase [Gammaproteobacteria bacterium]|nr:MAG: integrase [Gammaproteobacteria bacterium]